LHEFYEKKIFLGWIHFFLAANAFIASRLTFFFLLRSMNVFCPSQIKRTACTVLSLLFFFFFTHIFTTNTKKQTKMNNDKNTRSPYNPSQQENKPDRVHSHSTAHSTHAFCETFDQATRDIQQKSKSNSPGPDTKETMATGGQRRQHSGAAKEENEESLKEANSAVQLDRDVQQSRRGTDDAKQVSLDLLHQLEKNNNCVCLCKTHCIASLLLIKNI
jgi:hypothetical protein